VDQQAFKKVAPKNRLIKMRSKSESFEIRVEEIEAKTEEIKPFWNYGDPEIPIVSRE
jgi:BMFP domain-containing protein YqiC